MMQGGPEIDDVALLVAGLVKAVELVVVEIHAEGSASGVAAVQWAGVAALWAGAGSGQKAQVLEDARQE